MKRLLVLLSSAAIAAGSIALATPASADTQVNLTARDGVYNYDTEQVWINGYVGFAAADGYRMATRNVVIDLKSRRVIGSGGVEGAIPSGTFSADRLVADLGARTFALDGNARLRMVPGKLRMPQ